MYECWLLVYLHHCLVGFSEIDNVDNQTELNKIAILFKINCLGNSREGHFCIDI